MSTPDDDAPDRGRLRRREALTAFGGTALAGIIGACGGGGKETAQAATAASCVLSPEVTEGPYWIDGTLTRRDIREGRPGLPLEIVFTVQDAKTCKAIAKADVEIWHCDAGGEYSGFDDGSGGGPPGGSGGDAPTSTRYLRGHQVSAADGRVRFLTIFPGWYRGRTPHIHLKVHVGGRVVHTGQVFFDERTTAKVYRSAPYASHGQADTPHRGDSIFAQAGGAKAQLRLGRRSGGRRGYRGAITLGVAT